MTTEFKVIETQEQLDAIIGERIKRAKESTRKEFADFDMYKEAYEKQEALKKTYEEQIASLQKETQTTIEGLNSKIAKYEMDSVKTKACIEYGLPLEMASRLHGATEDDIMNDASVLSSFVKTKSAPPLRNPESKVENGVLSEFKKMNPDIKL